jgi:hypothetical protein
MSNIQLAFAHAGQLLFEKKLREKRVNGKKVDLLVLHKEVFSLFDKEKKTLHDELDKVQLTLKKARWLLRKRRTHQNIK